MSPMSMGNQKKIWLNLPVSIDISRMMYNSTFYTSYRGTRSQLSLIVLCSAAGSQHLTSIVVGYFVLGQILLAAEPRQLVNCFDIVLKRLTGLKLVRSK